MAYQNKKHSIAEMFAWMVEKGGKKFIIALIILGAFVAAYFGRLSYTKWREGSAQQDFAQFEELYKKHYHSSLLSYYKEYKTHILLQQNKKEEALAFLDTFDNAARPSLVPLFHLEHTLMQLDSADRAVVKQGEEDLKKL